MSDLMTGRIRTAEHSENISKSKKGVKMKTKICDLCNKEIGISNFNRHVNSCRKF